MNAPLLNPTAATSNSHATPRLLLVDDEPRLLSSLHALLDGHSLDLTTASNGIEATAELLRAPYDLVLLDLDMPGMSGHEVMDFINVHNLHVEVIVLSGHTEIDAAIGAINRRAYGYLRKPYREEELLQLVGNALGHRRLMAENRTLFAKLTQSEKLYRFLTDNSPDIIYTIDVQGRITYINGRVTALLGFEQDDLLGQHYSLLAHEEDLKHARYAFDGHWEGESPRRTIELRLRSRLPGQADKLFQVELRKVLFSSIGLSSDQISLDHVCIYAVARDITEKRRAEELITYQAYHDILTDLPNRALFRDRLELALAQARRKHQQLAVMFIDLDRFKTINDSLGHQKGDVLLRQLATRLKGCIRQSDTLARLGGDEFIVLLPDSKTRAQISVVAEKIMGAICTPFQIDGIDLHVSASIGISGFPDDGDNADELVRHADMAMYAVKADGKNGFGYYDKSLQQAVLDKVLLEQELRQALQNHELEMYYQPQVDVERNAIIGVEALMRWNHPRRGLLSAGTFLPLAEEVGMMVQLSDWMVDAICRDLRLLRADGYVNLRMSINLSPSCLLRDEFLHDLCETLQAHGIPARQLEIEITENVCIRNPETALRQLNQLLELGLRIAVDDFGTGYSSLAYLQRFAVHTLKIDRAFVHEINCIDGHFPVVRAIIAMAHGLGIDLVAEGVETASQASYLRQAGNHVMQGFLFYPALSLPTLRSTLSQRLQAVPALMPQCL